MLMGVGASCTNNMPRSGGNERTNIRPCAWRPGVSASQTWNTCLTFLPSLISSLPDGKASSGSIGPICALAPCIHANHSAQQAANAREQRRWLVGRRAGGWCMAVIVAEFHATCKIEAGEEHTLLARQAGGGPEAEAARHHAVHREAAPERLDTLLRQRVDRALLVALRREDAFFSFEQDGHVGPQRLAAAPFADAGDAEHQADTMPIAARGPADADAHTVPLIVFSGGARSAFALHLRVLPVQVQVQGAAHARAQIAAADRKTARSH